MLNSVNSRGSTVSTHTAILLLQLRWKCRELPHRMEKHQGRLSRCILWCRVKFCQIRSANASQCQHHGLNLWCSGDKFRTYIPVSFFTHAIRDAKVVDIEEWRCIWKWPYATLWNGFWMQYDTAKFFTVGGDLVMPYQASTGGWAATTCHIRWGHGQFGHGVPSNPMDT